MVNCKLPRITFLWLGLSLPSFAQADLATASASQVEVARVEVFDGVLEAVSSSTISARTQGEVLSIAFDVNDKVRRGDILLRLTDKEQTAVLQRLEAQRNKAAAQQAETQREMERIAVVFKRGLGAKAEMTAAEAAASAATAQSASAQAAVAEAREALTYTVLKAPYDMVITERHVEVGESVGVGTALLSGSAFNQMRVSVSVPQNIYWQIQESPKSEVRFEDGTAYPINASAITFFPRANARTHSFTLRLELPEGIRLARPGVFVKVAFTLGSEPRILVPTSALVRRDEITAVYVNQPEKRPQLRMVRAGKQHPQGTEILAGLAAGESVVLNPSQVLEDLVGKTSHVTQ